MRTAEQEMKWLISHELKSVRFHLGSGIVADSLEPVGTFKTNDGHTYFSDLLLGCTNDRFSIELAGPNGDEFLALHAKSATLRQNYPVDRIYPHGLRSVILHEDDLRVGLFGYLLNPYQERSDALEFEMEQQPQSEDWLSQFIEVKVNFNHFGKGVDLLVLYPTQQRSVGELADRIHLSARIESFRYIKAAFKIAEIKSLSKLKGGIDEAQFVVISHDYRILPSELVFVPVPAHILSKFR